MPPYSYYIYICGRQRKGKNQQQSQQHEKNGGPPTPDPLHLSSAFLGFEHMVPPFNLALRLLLSELARPVPFIDGSLLLPDCPLSPFAPLSSQLENAMARASAAMMPHPHPWAACYAAVIFGLSLISGAAESLEQYC